MIDIKKTLDDMTARNLANGALKLKEAHEFDAWLNRENAGGASFRISFPGYIDSYIFSAADIFKACQPLVYQARLERFVKSVKSPDKPVPAGSFSKRHGLGEFSDIERDSILEAAGIVKYKIFGWNNEKEADDLGISAGATKSQAIKNFRDENASLCDSYLKILALEVKSEE